MRGFVYTQSTPTYRKDISVDGALAYALQALHMLAQFFIVYLKVVLGRALLVAVAPLPHAATAYAVSSDERAAPSHLTLRLQLAPLPSLYSLGAPVYRHRGFVGAPEWGEWLTADDKPELMYLT
ncbi:hypothetical protein PR002_g13582 [Phytophthora rubi]|uniref:Uncharacterized protein n=1 Tax=Phytophthora rubi TaxID=129364 RepID=A0A6A3LFR2_9STRA|nr:hypothetical protein PR002_g13582 [Phytophthora rubi]